MTDPQIPALAALIADRVEGRSIIGIGGAVCVGKSTLARSLAGALEAVGRRATVLCTDAFLLANDDLDARGLSFRKGFPETFDVVGLEQCLIDVRKGPVEAPVYSHAIYDIVADEHAVVDGDVIIVEGLNALQEPAIRHLDVAIYLEADDADVRTWFLTRFFRLRDQGRNDPQSFYAPMADFEDEAIEGLATGVWDAVNGPNLDEHIRPTRRHAHLVVRKSRDHAIQEIVEGDR